MNYEFVLKHAPALAIKPRQVGHQGFLKPSVQEGMTPPEFMYDQNTQMPLNYIQQAGQEREFYVPEGGMPVAELRGTLDPENLMRPAQGGTRYGQRGTVPIPPMYPQGTAGGAPVVRPIPPQMPRGAAGGAPAVRPLPTASAPVRPPNPPVGAPAPMNLEMFPTGAVEANIRGMAPLHQSENAIANYSDLDEDLGSWLRRLMPNIRLPNVGGSGSTGETSHAGTAGPAGEPRRQRYDSYESSPSHQNAMDIMRQIDNAEAQRRLRQFGDDLERRRRGAPVRHSPPPIQYENRD